MQGQKQKEGPENEDRDWKRPASVTPSQPAREIGCIGESSGETDDCYGSVSLGRDVAETGEDGLRRGDLCLVPACMSTSHRG